MDVASLREEPKSLDDLMEAYSAKGEACIDAANAWTELSHRILLGFRDIRGTIVESP
jgi:hypothetical protein